MNHSPQLRLGIDLGGSKIEGIILDAQGQIRARQRIATPKADYDATLTALQQLIEHLEAQVGEPATIGLGIPGSLSPKDQRVRNANSTWLNGRRLDDDLSQLLQRPVRIANDADCFALSEATDGAAAGADSVFGVIIGTGVGGGVVIRQRLLSGPNRIAGEWGHNPLPWPTAVEWPGRQCFCGRYGCIETWLSGPGLAYDHQQHTGQTLTAIAIASAAAAGDLQAEASLQRYEQRLARALASVINLLDPQYIVLGGGLSQLSRLYERVPQLWGEYVFSDYIATQLVPPKYGDASGVRGAAWLWPL